MSDDTKRTKALWIAAFPFIIVGMAVEYLFVWLGVAVLWVTCQLGWHSWAFEPWLRVPGYSAGAWQCMICHRIKVRP